MRFKQGDIVKLKLTNKKAMIMQVVPAGKCNNFLKIITFGIAGWPYPSHYIVNVDGWHDHVHAQEFELKMKGVKK